jgi:hypothetical protein
MGMKKIFLILTTATIFLFGILTIYQGNTGMAQAQKTQDQIWQEQHEGQVMKCLVTGPIKEYEGATGQSTAESDEILERCNHDMLYMLGICEQNNDEYTFCDSVHNYIDDNNLDQISERPEQLSQETIDRINEFDWNEDGVTDGSDFVSK